MVVKSERFKDTLGMGYCQSTVCSGGCQLIHKAKVLKSCSRVPGSGWVPLPPGANRIPSSKSLGVAGVLRGWGVGEGGWGGGLGRGVGGGWIGGVGLAGGLGGGGGLGWWVCVWESS